MEVIVVFVVTVGLIALRLALARNFWNPFRGAPDVLSSAGANALTAQRIGQLLALGQIGPAAKPALPALIKTLSDKHEAVDYAAAYALGLGCP